MKKNKLILNPLMSIINWSVDGSKSKIADYKNNIIHTYYTNYQSFANENFELFNRLVEERCRLIKNKVDVKIFLSDLMDGIVSLIMNIPKPQLQEYQESLESYITNVLYLNEVTTNKIDFDVNKFNKNIRNFEPQIYSLSYLQSAYKLVTKIKRNITEQEDKVQKNAFYCSVFFLLLKNGFVFKKGKQGGNKSNYTSHVIQLCEMFKSIIEGNDKYRATIETLIPKKTKSNQAKKDLKKLINEIGVPKNYNKNDKNIINNNFNLKSDGSNYKLFEKVKKYIESVKKVNMEYDEFYLYITKTITNI